MKGRRILAFVMAFLIVMSMLPTMVFASEDAVQLTGELKLKGTTEGKVEPGNVLSADYAKVLPEGFTDDLVTFLWVELDPEDVEYQKDIPLEERQYPVIRELGGDKNLTVTEDSVGFDIMLTVTAKEEYGYTGSLYVISEPVVKSVSTAMDVVEEFVDSPDDASVIILDDEPEYAEDYYEPDAETEDADLDVFSDELKELAEESGLREEEAYQEEETYQEEDTYQEAPDSSFYEVDLNPVIDITTSEIYDSEDPDARSVESADPVYIEEGAEDPVYEVRANTDIVNFGTLETSEDSSYYAQQAKVVEVTNTGDEPLNFDEIAPEHFMVADIEETLEPADTVSLWIQPRAGLEPGTYTDTISYISQEGAAVSYDATVVIEEPQAEQTETITEDQNTVPEVQQSDISDEIWSDDSETDILETVDISDDVNVVVANAPDDPGIENPAEQNPGTEEQNAADPEGENPDAADPEGEKNGTVTENPNEGENPDEGETEEPVISLSFANEAYKSLSFSSSEEGTAVPDAQAVIVTNTGNVSVTLKEPSGVTNDFNVSHTDDLTLEPGENLTFTIQPKADLPKGTYEGYVNYYLEGEDEARLSTWVSYQVTEKKQDETVKLIRIQTPSAVTGIVNGTPKDVSGLGLPASVVIETSDGTKNAAVVWNLQDSSYRPDVKIAQTFQVTGTVSLPEGVTNPDGISLQTAVNVSVDAETYVPVTVSGADNKILGIVENGEYPAQQGIKFQAVGAGMDNKNPQIGDQRYLPLSCTVVKTYPWESAPYEATIRLSNPGDYTLKVLFNLQEYTESGWTNVAGAQDTKTVNFRVVSANPTATATPTITPTPAGKKAVATGDDTPILPLVIILVAAVAVAVGVVVIRKKK